MNKFNINITPEEILRQKENEKKKPINVFSEKNYLQARLGKNEDTKTLVVRLLPFTKEGGSPFHKVYMHQVRVNKELSPSGWKIFPCPSKNGNHSDCPFCEIAQESKLAKLNATTEFDKKRYNDVEFANSPREMWIARVIERGHEEDGVKFWLFAHSKKGDGVFDKIFNIFQRRFEKAAKNGEYNNIFDLNAGKDLLITLTKDTNNKTVINITDDDEKTPLSNDYDLALKWLNDEKDWTSVYTFKPYDYMAIVAQGGIPVFNKDEKKFVDKNVADKIANEEIEKQLTQVPNDYLTLDTSNINLTPSNNVDITNYDDDLIF